MQGDVIEGFRKSYAKAINAHQPFGDPTAYFTESVESPVPNTMHPIASPPSSAVVEAIRADEEAENILN